MIWSDKTSFRRRLKNHAFMCGFICILLVGWMVGAQPTNVSFTNSISFTNSFVPPPQTSIVTNNPNSPASSNSVAATTSTNLTGTLTLKEYHNLLAKAQNLVNTRQLALAEPALVDLLAERVPDEIRSRRCWNWPQPWRRKMICRARNPFSRNILSAGRVMRERRKFSCVRANCSGRWA